MWTAVFRVVGTPYELMYLRDDFQEYSKSETTEDKIFPMICDAIRDKMGWRRGKADYEWRTEQRQYIVYLKEVPQDVTELVFNSNLNGWIGGH